MKTKPRETCTPPPPPPLPLSSPPTQPCLQLSEWTQQCSSEPLGTIFLFMTIHVNYSVNTYPPCLLSLEVIFKYACVSCFCAEHRTEAVLLLFIKINVFQHCQQDTVIQVERLGNGLCTWNCVHETDFWGSVDKHMISPEGGAITLLKCPSGEQRLKLNLVYTFKCFFNF